MNRQKYEFSSFFCEETRDKIISGIVNYILCLLFFKEGAKTKITVLTVFPHQFYRAGIREFHKRFTIEIRSCACMVSTVFQYHVCVFFVGFTTDGEFNSLRTGGVRRPISVIELIKNAKSEAKGMPVKIVSSLFRLDKEGTVC